MAAILPTVPIEMPDLAGQAFKLQEYRTAQKKEAADQAQKERSARASQVGVNKLYEQAGEVGQLLNRFKPEVQKAFDTAVKLGEQYTYSGLEEDKRAYLESLGGFNGLLGGSKFLTNNYLEQVNAYRKDPSSFSVTGQDFIDLTTGYSNTPAPVEEIMDINSVFTLPRAEEFKYLAPDAMANQGVQLAYNMANMFSPDGVSYDKAAYMKHARVWLPTMFPVNSNAELQAVLYGAQALGDGGLGLNRNPSSQDIQRYAALPQEEKEKFKQVYYNDVYKQLEPQVPTQIGQRKEKDANEGIAKQSIPYMDLVPRTVGVADAKFTKAVLNSDDEVVTPSSMKKEGAKRNVEMYELPDNLFIKTGTFDITGFGVGDDGTQYIKKRRKAKDGTLEIVTDRADSRDLQIIRNKIGADAYSKYFYY